MARDRTFKPVTNTKKYYVPQSEIDEIRDDAKSAQELLDNPYLKNYCKQSQKSILTIHAKQSIYDSEESIENEGNRKTIKYPAEKEYNMLAGQYRFIDQLFIDLKSAVQLAKTLDEKIKSGEVEVKVEDVD